ncbi:MAG: plastocyanin/azurin family copper-binding protein [Solirubrobacterales bacterium]
MKRNRERAIRYRASYVAMGVLLGVGIGSLPGLASADRGTERPEPRSSTSSKIAKCKKIKDSAKRRECILTAKGRTVAVLVEDNYYSPSQLSIRPYDTVLWNWKDSTSSEGHDVGLQSGPAGVSFREFLSRVYTGPTGRFKRTFKKPGTYSFICSLHYEMQMQVAVRK